MPRYLYYLCNDMKKSNIIELFYKNGLIQAECKKFCRDAFLCDDLIQEIVVILLDKSDTLIEQLNEKGELLYYINKVIRNQFNSSTSPFFKKYKLLNNITNEYSDTETL